MRLCHAQHWGFGIDAIQTYEGLLDRINAECVLLVQGASNVPGTQPSSLTHRVLFSILKQACIVNP